MIFTWKTSLKIGKIYSESDFGKKLQMGFELINDYRFIVIREASKEEYLNEMHELYPEFKDKIHCFDYFYEIHAD
jgi:hypothetical protein